MRDLVMDGNGWRTKDDVYDSFFRVVGAPPWHGRNFDALIDSIQTGQINEIEVPYRIIICNFDLIGPDALEMTRNFVDLILELAAQGRPVQLELKDSIGVVGGR